MKLKNLFALLLSGIISVTAFINAGAETVPMTMKELDKSYLTLVFDDNTDSLKTFYDIISIEYGYPICAAVPSQTLGGDNALLHDIENHGGEILSHTKTHKIFNRNVPWEVVESEMRDSLNELTKAGFDIKGIILAGGEGGESSNPEYRADVEKITSKYYAYSDLYGNSEQYYKPRIYMNDYFNNNPNIAVSRVQNLAQTEQWEVWFAHNTSELNEETLRAMLNEIKKQEKAGKLEVVTYRTMYKNHANWSKSVDLGSTKYTVDFYSTDNKTLLSSVVTKEGSSAVAPEIETARGVSFKKWSGSISNVTKNISVYAICEGVKMTDDSAVGLKHEHFFFDWDTTQVCGLCGLVTSKPPVTKEPVSSALSSNVSDTLSADSSKPEITSSESKESGTVASDTGSLPKTPQKTSKVTLVIPICVVAVVLLIGVAIIFVIKKQKSK